MTIFRFGARRQIEIIKNLLMQLKFFSVPLLSNGEEEELNKFLRSVKVLDLRRELVMASESACWAICVLYLPQTGPETPASTPASKGFAAKGRIDYREVLSPDDFNIFCELRKIRKQISESDAVPPYVIFTDAELSEIVKSRVCTPESLRKINGVGAGKVEKYGKRFCEMAVQFFNSGSESSAKNEESDTPF